MSACKQAKHLFLLTIQQTRLLRWRITTLCVTSGALTLCSASLRCVCFSPGEHLRLCPQDYTCCSSQMEETLSLQSERDFLRAVEENSQFLLTTFTQRHRRFDGKASVGYLALRLILAVHGSETELESTRSPCSLHQKVWLTLGFLFFSHIAAVPGESR